MAKISRIFLSLVAGAILLESGCAEKATVNEGKMERDENGRIVMGDVYLAPESESRERAGVLPSKPSEDVRGLLGKIDALASVSDQRPGDQRDYLPDPAVSWVLDVQFKGNPQLDPQKVGNLFDEAWRKRFGGFMDYGRDIATGRWTFLISRDGPKAVDQLKYAFDYYDTVGEVDALSTEKLFAQRLEQITEKLAAFGSPTITPSATPLAAAQRAAWLQETKKSLDRDVVLVLKAPRGQKFEGIKIWDVMLCLGLEWGDMDCFHFQNETGVGDDYFFSVETSTAPGYFLPEEVAAGKVRVDDLVFVFSIPRSANPVAVFEAMNKAVGYCQKRLGGEIVDRAGDKVDTQAIRTAIEQTVEQLKAAGFQPGRDATLQLF